jgi:hypothetical protein
VPCPVTGRPPVAAGRGVSFAIAEPTSTGTRCRGRTRRWWGSPSTCVKVTRLFLCDEDCELSMMWLENDSTFDYLLLTVGNLCMHGMYESTGMYRHHFIPSWINDSELLFENLLTIVKICYIKKYTIIRRKTFILYHPTNILVRKQRIFDPPTIKIIHFLSSNHFG